MSNSLGSLIRDGRTAKRMTMRELARRIGVSAPYMHDVEHDRRPLSLDRCGQISAVLDIPVAELEARAGVSRDLLQWLRSRPDVIVLLHDARRTGQCIVLVPRPHAADDLMSRRIGGFTHEDIMRRDPPPITIDEVREALDKGAKERKAAGRTQKRSPRP